MEKDKIVCEIIYKKCKRHGCQKKYTDDDNNCNVIS